MNFNITMPATNEDGSVVTAAEITGHQIGWRLASGTVGNYTEIAIPLSQTTVPESTVTAGLAPGSYFAACRTVGPTNSPWSAEVPFTIAPPVPNAPGFSLA